jgi:hypothetical protein
MWRLILGGRILRVGLGGDDEVVIEVIEVGGWDLRFGA